MAVARFSGLVKVAKENIKELVGKEPLSVISLAEEGGKSIVVLEVLERKAVPDTQNLIGEYKLTFDKDYKLLGYNRVSVRRKGDTCSAEVGEEEAK